MYLHKIKIEILKKVLNSEYNLLSLKDVPCAMYVMFN